MMKGQSIEDDQMMIDNMIKDDNCTTKEVQSQAGQTIYPHNETNLQYFTNHHSQDIISGNLSSKDNKPIIPDDMSSILINSDNSFNQMFVLSRSKFKCITTFW